MSAVRLHCGAIGTEAVELRDLSLRPDCASIGFARPHPPPIPERFTQAGADQFALTQSELGPGPAGIAELI